mgnify:CR=1 FL=1
MKQTHHKIFVYGSLRSGFHHPAYHYISRYFTLVCNATVKGILSDMGEFPAAVPTTDELFIKGELYTINNADEFSWAIGQLDDYEGVNAEEEELPLFRRELADVYMDNAEPAKAWVYWYNGNTDGKPLIASGDVLEYFYNKNKNA